MYRDKSKGVPYQDIVDLEVALELMHSVMAVLRDEDKEKWKQAKRIEESITTLDPINTRNVLDFFGPIFRSVRDGKMTWDYFVKNVDIDFKPIVSIIVPVYNVAPYLKRAINSLRMQTLRHIEIICVDDCSTDNSLEILEEFAKIDDRIKVVKHEKNLGVSSARNSGLEIAKSDYFMFLDPDDYAEPTFCEKMIKAIEGGDYDMAVCNVKIEVAPDMPNDRGYKNERFYASDDTVWCWNKIFKRKLIMTNYITFPDGLLGEDAYFTNCYKLVSNKNYFLIPEKLYTYQIRKDSLMSAFDKPDNQVVFDCFGIANLTYQFFTWKKVKQEEIPLPEKVIIPEHYFHEKYNHFFKSINIAIRYFGEKYNKELARRIYELIKDKKEIQVGDGCFVVDVCDRFETKKDDRARFRIERIIKEKRFYECENKELLSMVKELLSHTQILTLK